MAEMTEAEKRKAAQDSFNKMLVTTAKEDKTPEKKDESPGVVARLFGSLRDKVAAGVPGKGLTDKEREEKERNQKRPSKTLTDGK